VLDFGLAKALDQGAGIGDQGSAHLANSPTITSPAMTMRGVILGTAAYMAPEQAKGKLVDRRADIWAFGVVIYEMLTGRRLFDAEGLPETLAAVLTRDVSMTTLPAAIPVRLGVLLRNCLIRDPRQRLRDIGEARRVLDWIIAGAPDDSVAPAGVSATASMSAAARALPWALAVAFALVALLLWAPWRSEKPADLPLVVLDVDVGADAHFPSANNIGGSSIAISRDGTRLLYVSGTPPRLFTRRLDQPRATELPGTRGASFPFFSPDGQWAGFGANGKVNKISVEGGAVVPLGEVAGSAGATWLEDGRIIVSDVFGKGLLQIPAAGGSPTIVAASVDGAVSLVAPHVLPGGKAILSAACTLRSADHCNIEVLTLADGRRKILAQRGQSPHYLPSSSGTGHLLYINRAILFAIPFDLATLETRGPAVPMLDDVAYASGTGVGQFDVSRTGTLIYRRLRLDAEPRATVHWVDSAGKMKSIRDQPASYGDSNPMVSPDGSRIAMEIAEGANRDIWVYHPQRNVITRLTFGGLNAAPIWRPDGQHVVFAKLGQGIFQARADGAGPPQELIGSQTFQVPGSFTPDGKRLAYYESAPFQIWTVPLEDQRGQLKAGKPELFLHSGFQDVLPSFSPDGRWLAYMSNESGRNEVYVRPFPPASSGHDGKWQISNNGGVLPRWSGAGHELVYRSGDQLMSVSYSVIGDGFVAEKPRVWISKLGGTAWDLAPDGKRVAVMIRESSAQAPQQERVIVMFMNFADELRRRVPLWK
jgi:serine/threonine-protein kinase